MSKDGAGGSWNGWRVNLELARASSSADTTEQREKQNKNLSFHWRGPLSKISLIRRLSFVTLPIPLFPLLPSGNLFFFFSLLSLDLSLFCSLLYGSLLSSTIAIIPSSSFPKLPPLSLCPRLEPHLEFQALTGGSAHFLVLGFLCPLGVRWNSHSKAHPGGEWFFYIFFDSRTFRPCLGNGQNYFGVCVLIFGSTRLNMICIPSNLIMNN